jgi:glycosyltransferase involved in cell wall biosynthesis
MWLQFADAIMACSTWVADFYEALLERPVAVVPNTTWMMDTGAAMPPAPPRFVMLATLEFHKRADLFIEAAALVRSRQPKTAFECRVYGDGAREQREKLQQTIERHGLGAVFKLYPAQSDTAAIYRDATCAVVPSDIEPFSMVCIEAAAHGRPVIATRSGGPQDIVADGETGFLIETGDSGALADRMLRMLAEPDTAAQMGAAARRRFERDYAPEAVMPQYLAVLDAALSQSSAERRRIGQVAARYFMTRHEA